MYEASTLYEMNNGQYSDRLKNYFARFGQITDPGYPNKLNKHYRQAAHASTQISASAFSAVKYLDAIKKTLAGLSLEEGSVAQALSELDTISISRSKDTVAHISKLFHKNMLTNDVLLDQYIEVFMNYPTRDEQDPLLNNLIRYFITLVKETFKTPVLYTQDTIERTASQLTDFNRIQNAKIIGRLYSMNVKPSPREIRIGDKIVTVDPYQQVIDTFSTGNICQRVLDTLLSTIYKTDNAQVQAETIQFNREFSTFTTVWREVYQRLQTESPDRFEYYVSILTSIRDSSKNKDKTASFRYTLMQKSEVRNLLKLIGK